MIKECVNLFISGTKTMFKEFFKKETNKKQRANMWSFSRLIIPIITLITSIISIITGSIPLLVLSSIIAGLGAVTDKLDGASAIKHKSQSEYGKLLDQVTDKFFAIVVGANVSYLNPVFLITLLGEGIIGVINIIYRYKYKDISMKSSMIGRIKEWPLYAALALGFLSSINSTLFTVANIAAIIAFIFQLATAGSYIIQNNNEVKKSKNKSINNVQIEETIDDSKDKELVLDKKKGNSNKEVMTKKEQYQNLRNLLNEVYELKANENVSDKNSIQKVK